MKTSGNNGEWHSRCESRGSDGTVMLSIANSVAKTAQQLDLGGNRPRGRPKKRWMDRIKDDMKAVNVTAEDALVRKEWRMVFKRADRASSGI